MFWPELGYTKRDLLQYYADVSSGLLPHLTDWAMVMKRYPNGIHGKWFFMKRTPSPRPEWLETCEIMHKSENPAWHRAIARWSSFGRDRKHSHQCDAVPPCQWEVRTMPEKTTVEKARADLRAGKSPTTAAGEFVREEIEHIRQGKHGARSPEQAIAIGLSKARRAGVPLKPPKKGQAKKSTRRSAARDYEVGQGKRRPRRASRKRSTAMRRRLKREPKSTVSSRALSRHAKTVARKRKKA